MYTYIHIYNKYNIYDMIYREPTLYSYYNFISHLFVRCSYFIAAIVFASRHIYFKRNLAQVITLVVLVITLYC